MRRLTFLLAFLLWVAPVSAACVASNAYETAVCADTPAYFLPLKESSGTTANDISGNSVNGTYTASGITYSQPGPFTGGQTSVKLDGANTTSIAIGTITAVKNSSIEVWVKRPSTGTGMIAYYGQGGANGWGIHIGRAGVQTEVGDLMGGLAAGTANGHPSDGLSQWHMIDYTLSNATPPVRHIYIDGISYSFASNLNTPNVPAVSFTIGSDATDNHLLGWVAEYSVFATELTPTQVTNHYNAAAAILATNTSGDCYTSAILLDRPAVLYRLDEPSGVTATDSSGNGSDGSYVATTTYGVTGPFGTHTGVHFDAVAGHVAAPILSSSSIYQAIEGWVNEADGSQHGPMAANTNVWTGGVGSTNIDTNGTNPVALFDSVRHITFTGPPNLSTAAWHYLVFDIDSSGVPTVSVDGGAFVTQAASGGGIGGGDTNFEVGLDASRILTSGVSVADVAYYSFPLSSTQVSNHYAARLCTNSSGGGAVTNGTLFPYPTEGALQWVP